MSSAPETNVIVHNIAAFTEILAWRCRTTAHGAQQAARCVSGGSCCDPPPPESSLCICTHRHVIKAVNADETTLHHCLGPIIKLMPVQTCNKQAATRHRSNQQPCMMIFGRRECGCRDIIKSDVMRTALSTLKSAMHHCKLPL